MSGIAAYLSAFKGVAGTSGFTDNFTRANANPIGAPWVTLGSYTDLLISSNQCLASGSNSAAYNNTGAYNNDQYSQCTVIGTTAGIGVTVRCNTVGVKSCYIFIYQGSNTFQMYSDVNGTLVQLGADYTVVSGSSCTIKLAVAGTTLTPFVNGASQATRTDVALTSGSAGLFITSAGGQGATAWAGGNYP